MLWLWNRKKVICADCEFVRGITGMLPRCAVHSITTSMDYITGKLPEVTYSLCDNHNSNGNCRKYKMKKGD